MTCYDRGTILILVIAIILPILPLITEGLHFALNILIGETIGLVSVWFLSRTWEPKKAQDEA
ncbi:MAG: hypothetical protein ACFFED_18185 [Candidatus Thorarchaeota archaeon]